jgi:ankyrin repeat protein
MIIVSIFLSTSVIFLDASFENDPSTGSLKKHRTDTLRNVCKNGWIYGRFLIDNLLAEGANPNQKDDSGNNALTYVVSRGDKSRMSQLLASGKVDTGQIFDDKKTILHIAAESIHCDASVVDLLFKSGCPLDAVDASGKQPIDYAVDQNKRANFLALMSLSTEERNCLENKKRKR